MTDWLTKWQTKWQTDRLIDKMIDKPTDTQNDRPTDRQNDRQTDWQTKWQTDRLTDKMTDRPTDRASKGLSGAGQSKRTSGELRSKWANEWPLFSRGLRDSISHCRSVALSVCLSPVGRSVGRSVCLSSISFFGVLSISDDNAKKKIRSTVNLFFASRWWNR